MSNKELNLDELGAVSGGVGKAGSIQIEVIKEALFFNKPGGSTIGGAHMGTKCAYVTSQTLSGKDWYCVKYGGKDAWIEKKYVKVIK